MAYVVARAEMVFGEDDIIKPTEKQEIILADEWPMETTRNLFEPELISELPLCYTTASGGPLIGNPDGTVCPVGIRRNVERCVSAKEATSSDGVAFCVEGNKSTLVALGLRF